MFQQKSTTTFPTEERPFPYHQSYGLTDGFRMQVVLESYALSPKEAARNNKVSLASVYKWRKDCRIQVGPWLI